MQFDDTNLSQLTNTWAELISQKKDILANHKVPFTFWAKTVYSLVNALNVPVNLKGQFSAVA